MPSREPLVVAGVVLGLVVATVVPFAIPALALDAPWTGSAGASGGGRLGPSLVAPGPADRTAPAGATPSRAARDHLAEDVGPASPSPTGPAVRCDTPATGERFPLQAGGRVVTGEDVDVAVIDPSGFEVDDPRLRDHVAVTRSFATNEDLTIRNGGGNRHGTATATTVARLAPGADLHLANFRTARDFSRAVAWAVDRDVDVIVAPVSFPAKPDDGSAPVSRAVTRAAEEGIPVVVPAGNLADRHWEGTYRGGPWLRFGGNDTRLYLRGSEGTVQLWLWWNRSDADRPHDFHVVLYRDHGDTVERIATSEAYPGGPVGTNQVLVEQVRTNDLLSERLDDGTYFVRIKGPAGAVHRVELEAPTHAFGSPVAAGSLAAPATAKGPVIAVGAADPDTGRPLALSAWGPTADGRPGVDLLAPGRTAGPDGGTLTGTSAAAAYTGGVVALLTAVRPGLTPAQAEAVLEATARPVEGPGGELQTGHGLVRPAAALACLAGEPFAGNATG